MVFASLQWLGHGSVCLVCVVALAGMPSAKWCDIKIEDTSHEKIGSYSNLSWSLTNNRDGAVVLSERSRKGRRHEKAVLEYLCAMGAKIESERKVGLFSVSRHLLMLPSSQLALSTQQHPRPHLALAWEMKPKNKSAAVRPSCTICQSIPQTTKQPQLSNHDIQLRR